MTIEDFEKEVRQIYVDKGWKPVDSPYWFTINIESIYHQKKITIVDKLTHKFFIGKGQRYDEAFDNCLKVLKESKDRETGVDWNALEISD